MEKLKDQKIVLAFIFAVGTVGLSLWGALTTPLMWFLGAVLGIATFGAVLESYAYSWRKARRHGNSSDAGVTKDMQLLKTQVASIHDKLAELAEREPAATGALPEDARQQLQALSNQCVMQTKALTKVLSKIDRFSMRAYNEVYD